MGVVTGGSFRSVCRFIESSFVSLVALSGTFFILFVSSEVARADNDLTGLKAKLQQLQAATDIVLMIIPYPTSFRARVDELRLPDLSCVYAIDSGRGSSFNETLDVIGNAVIEYDDRPKLSLDLRVSVVFRSDGKVLQEFYFDDWGGQRQVNGFSSDHRMLASAELPNQLGALVMHKDVVLIKTDGSACPHS